MSERGGGVYMPLRCRLFGHAYEHVYAYGAESDGVKVIICRRRHCTDVLRTYIERRTLVEDIVTAAQDWHSKWVEHIPSAAAYELREILLGRKVETAQTSSNKQRSES